jgi:hypothetical protein
MTDEAPKPQTLLEAIHAVQKAAPVLAKEAAAGDGRFSYKYTDIAALARHIGPLLSENMLVFTTWPGADNNDKPILDYELAHVTSQEKKVGTIPLFIAKTDMQAFGSALTYARRYALVCVLNLATEDDDGKAAGEKPKPGTAPLSTEDLAELRAAAKGLSEQQVQLALAATGLPVVKPFDIARAIQAVPHDKVLTLAHNLSGIDR